MPRFSEKRTAAKIAEIEAYAHNQHERYGAVGRPFKGTPEEKRQGQLYIRFMERRGGYDALAKRVTSSSQSSPPGSRTDRIQLIRERHRKLILEPRSVLESLILNEPFFVDDGILSELEAPPQNYSHDVDD